MLPLCGSSPQASLSRASPTFQMPRAHPKRHQPVLGARGVCSSHDDHGLRPPPSPALLPPTHP
eukprot:8520461-Prorocentrum_lima.AAC.1